MTFAKGAYVIELGSKVRDTLTGLTGIVIARTEWLYGCARVKIQPHELKDGKPVDTWTVDEPQAEVLRAPASKYARRETGGPRPEPTRSATPSRR